MALAAVAVYLTGEPAEELVEGMVGVSDPVLERHEEAALLATILAGVLGAVALGGLVFTRRRSPVRVGLLVLVRSVVPGRRPRSYGEPGRPDPTPGNPRGSFADGRVAARDRGGGGRRPRVRMTDGVDHPRPGSGDRSTRRGTRRASDRSPSVMEHFTLQGDVDMTTMMTTKTVEPAEAQGARESGRPERSGRTDTIEMQQHGFTGMLWFAAWLFTIGFLDLPFWKAVLALVVWPYYLGASIGPL